jgi:hypothetical protein
MRRCKARIRRLRGWRLYEERMRKKIEVRVEPARRRPPKWMS